MYRRSDAQQILVLCVLWFNEKIGSQAFLFDSFQTVLVFFFDIYKRWLESFPIHKKPRKKWRDKCMRIVYCVHDDTTIFNIS